MTPAPRQVDRLTDDDVEGGLLLSTEAGWNQTAADWAYLLRAGQGFGVRAERRLIATSLALPYPPDFGWISMVLVTEEYRRRGLATLVLEVAVDHLVESGLVPMLDATPEGRAVYIRMGFVETEQFDRWQGMGRGVDDVQTVEGALNLDNYAALDKSAFGSSRIHLVRELASRPGSLALSTSAGYAVCRRGRVASQIGPVVARTDAGGRELVRQMLSATAGPTVADLRPSADAIAQDLAGRGFAIQRRFHRMAYGRSSGYGDKALYPIIAGPELG